MNRFNWFWSMAVIALLIAMLARMSFVTGQVWERTHGTETEITN